MNLTRFFLLGLLILISPLACAFGGVTVAGKNYEINMMQPGAPWDLYPSSAFFASVSASTSNLHGGNTNYISNIGTGANQIFNVSSGTAIDFNASTANIQNLYIAGELTLPPTVYAHTFRGFEIFTSTIYAGSPLRIIGASEIKFADGTQQFTAAATATNTITNTDQYQPKQFNISSGTVEELSVSTGALKLVSANLEMNDNIIYLSKDKQTYIWYDLANRWVRHYLEGIECFRLEK